MPGTKAMPGRDKDAFGALNGVPLREPDTCRRRARADAQSDLFAHVLQG